MPNKPSLDKTRITLRMPIQIRAKMRAMMRESDGTLTENDIALEALERILENVKLTKEDKEWAKQERQKNETWRKNNG